MAKPKKTKDHRLMCGHPKRGQKKKKVPFELKRRRHGKT